tara:strand:+ start:290 stop:508 length:219 start_codon:yes stop_codon:yes gene_type:complete
MSKKVRKIIKVLARKCIGLDRKKKIQEMNRGLTALALVWLRQSRDHGMVHLGYNYDDILEVEKLLKRASVRR